MRISQSRESKEQLIAKQFIFPAALCISLLPGASSARAQADTTMPPANITILSNLRPSNTDPYFTDTSIVTLNGGCIVGTVKLDINFCGRHRGETWLAMPFTPKQNSHATLLQAAVGVFDGTNQFLLTLFNDGNGILGTALATVTATDAPPSNTCCKVATANLGTPGIGLYSSEWTLRRVWSHALPKDESSYRLTE